MAEIFNLNSTIMDRKRHQSTFDCETENKIQKTEFLDCLSVLYKSRIRPYFDVVDKLRQYGLQQDFNLPKIVAIGDQGCGKSSVIEAICGISLPRGRGIITKCPLELQLKRVSPHHKWQAILTYKIVNGDYKNLVITQPDEIPKFIYEAQQEICGTENNVSRELITLKIESPSETAPDLTFLDLPGVVGYLNDDQPINICQQLTNLITTYTNYNNDIILYVIAGNCNTVSESLKLLHKVDPCGVRTFAIVTKPDIANLHQKENIAAVLNIKKSNINNIYHLIKCRSQKQLDEDIPLVESLANETEFFQLEDCFKNSQHYQIGTMNLVSRIVDELETVIKSTMPELQDKVNKCLKESKNELIVLAPEIPSNIIDKQIYLIELLAKMNDEIKLCLNKGKTSVCDVNVFSEWRNYFNIFRDDIELIRNKDMNSTFSLTNLMKLLSEQRGHEISGFLNYELFENLISNHIQLYKLKADDLLLQISKRTEELILKILSKYLDHLPNFSLKVKKIAHEQIELSILQSAERIECIFNEEKVIFTMDSSFEKEMSVMKSSASGKLDDVQLDNKLNEDRCRSETRLFGTNSRESNSPSFIFTPQTYPVMFGAPRPPIIQDRKPIPLLNKTQIIKKKNLLEEANLERNAERLLDIIKCYLKIVHARLIDSIPMAIRRCLHIELIDKLKTKFINFAILPENYEKLMEDEKQIENRKLLKERIERLELVKYELLGF